MVGLYSIYALRIYVNMVNAEREKGDDNSLFPFF